MELTSRPLILAVQAIVAGAEARASPVPEANPAIRGTRTENARTTAHVRPGEILVEWSGRVTAGDVGFMA